MKKKFLIILYLAFFYSLNFGYDAINGAIEYNENDYIIENKEIMLPVASNKRIILKNVNVAPNMNFEIKSSQSVVLTGETKIQSGNIIKIAVEPSLNNISKLKVSSDKVKILANGIDAAQFSASVLKADGTLYSENPVVVFTRTPTWGNFFSNNTFKTYIPGKYTFTATLSYFYPTIVSNTCEIEAVPVFDLGITQYSANKAKISWNNIRDALNYKVYRDNEEIAITSNNYFDDTNIECNQEYTYSVKVIMRSNQEYNSEYVSFLSSPTKHIIVDEPDGSIILFNKINELKILVKRESGTETELNLGKNGKIKNIYTSKPLDRVYLLISEMGTDSLYSYSISRMKEGILEEKDYVTLSDIREVNYYPEMDRMYIRTDDYVYSYTMKGLSYDEISGKDSAYVRDIREVNYYPEMDRMYIRTDNYVYSYTMKNVGSSDEISLKDSIGINFDKGAVVRYESNETIISFGNQYIKIYDMQGRLLSSTPVSEYYFEAEGEIKNINLMPPILFSKQFENKIKLSWTKVLGAERYILYRKKEGESVYTQIASLSENSYFDTNITADKFYFYYIICTGNGKTSKGSDSVYILYNMDSDKDGLPDTIETQIGTYANYGDTDNDGLPDNYEILFLGTDPTKTDTNANGIADGNEDFDNDRITNIEEYRNKSSANNSDSDFDGLNDYDEIILYRTNPLNNDSDNDGWSDLSERNRGYDPLDPDDEKYMPVREVRERTLDKVFLEGINSECTNIKIKEVKIRGKGDINKLLKVIKNPNSDTNDFNKAILETPIAFEYGEEMEWAKITYQFLNNIDLNNVSFIHFDEVTNALIPEGNIIVDQIAKTITVTTTKFCTTYLADNRVLAEYWDLNNSSDVVTKAKADIMFVVDASGSMGEKNPTPIAKLLSTIDGFAQNLSNASVDTDFGVIEFNENIRYKGWSENNNVQNLKNMLSSIAFAGADERTAQALLKAVKSGYRRGVEKILVLLTDQVNEVEGGKAAIDAVANILKESGVKVFVISPTSIKSIFSGLIETDSHYQDISSLNYGTILTEIVREISVASLNYTWIRLSNGEIVKLKKNPNLGDKTIDTDSDKLPDLIELNKKINMNFRGRNFQAWTFHTHPARSNIYDKTFGAFSVPRVLPNGRFILPIMINEPGVKEFLTPIFMNAALAWQINMPFESWFDYFYGHTVNMQKLADAFELLYGTMGDIVVGDIITIAELTSQHGFKQGEPLTLFDNAWNVGSLIIPFMQTVKRTPGFKTLKEAFEYMKTNKDIGFLLNVEGRPILVMPDEKTGYLIVKDGDNQPVKMAVEEYVGKFEKISNNVNFDYLSTEAKDFAKANIAEKQGVWKMHPFKRGWLIEEHLGGWGTNFPVIDYAEGFSETGVATKIKSIKSMDVDSKSYQASNAVYRKIMNYAEEVSRYTSKRGKIVVSGETVKIEADEMTKRYLEIAIPDKNISPEIQAQIERARTSAAQIGEGRSVEIVIKKINDISGM